MTKEAKKAAMIRYLKERGTIFSDFISSTEEKKKKVQARGRYPFPPSITSRRRMSIDKNAEEEILTPTSDIDLINITSQPSCIQGTMRDYQIAALNWLVNQHQLGLNSILADEMGLGKTLETISLLGFLSQYLQIQFVFKREMMNRGPHLVLVPKSTLGNWVNEFKRFCPSLKPFRFHGSKEERVELVKRLVSKKRDWDVVITTYEMAVIEKGAFGRIHWEYI